MSIDDLSKRIAERLITSGDVEAFENTFTSAERTIWLALMEDLGCDSFVVDSEQAECKRCGVLAQGSNTGR
jgi:hypothetical protein